MRIHQRATGPGSNALIERQPRRSLITPMPDPSASNQLRPSVKRKCCKERNCFARNVCVRSKSAMIVLLWNVVVGGIITSAVYTAPLVVSSIENANFGKVLISIIWLTGFLAIAMMFYPLGGLLADVYLGRYRAVIISLIVLLVCMLTVCVDIGVYIAWDHVPESEILRISFIVLTIVAMLLVVIGQSGYASNIVQLSLDQLLEEPSQKLGVFVHWLQWAHMVGQTFVHVLYTMWFCDGGYAKSLGKNSSYIIYAIPVTFFVLLAVLLLLNCCTRKLFYTDKVKYNPYKMVFKVLNFARNNKRPLGRSSFYYHDDTEPTRIDYAKERYGGPFTTSDVEDVKTFTRVLLVLLALGPVFILEVSTSHSMLSLLAIHSGTDNIFVNRSCTAKWVVLESGTLSSLTSIFFLPFYIWIIYSLLRNRVPKILLRLGASIFLYIMANLSMLVVDLIGHIVVQVNEGHGVKCMFVQNVWSQKHHLDTLNLHWAMLILPNIMRGIAPALVIATSLEFISAQSPHAMKGVLVGMLFAIKGFAQLIAAILFIPFTVKHIWKDGYLGENPPVTSCGFGYFLVTTAMAVLGLILFTVAARKYSYRKREEEPFSQAYVEEIFRRRLAHRRPRSHNQQDESPLVPVEDDDHLDEDDSHQLHSVFQLDYASFEDSSRSDTSDL